MKVRASQLTPVAAVIKLIPTVLILWDDTEINLFHYFAIRRNYEKKAVHGHNFFVHGARAPSGSRPPHCRGFTITLRYTPRSVELLWTNDQPDSGSATRQHTALARDVYRPAELETEIPASERWQTHAASGAGSWVQNTFRNAVCYTHVFLWSMR